MIVLDATAAGVTTGGEHLNLMDLASTGVYGLVGIALFVLAYKIFDWVTPFSLDKELLEEHNVAVGVVVAGFMIGVAIIVSAAIV